MDLKSLGEFGLIDRISANFDVPEGVTGIGDDCAVIPQQSGKCTLVTTDMLMEGTHFLMEDVSPYRLGWKSAAVNISDIAAMGGSPVGSFLAFALPAGLDSSWTDEFISGYKAVSDLSSTPLLGGDSTGSPVRVSVCVTVLGECPAGKEVRRSGAKVGDLICVTGPLGDSAGGLKVILDGLPRGEDESTLVDRHYRPLPKVTEGLALAAAGVHSMMDISDGIGSDLRHILDASHVGAEVDCGCLPLSDCMCRCAAVHGWSVEDLAVNGGEDYELLFTTSEEAACRIGIPYHVIGRIVAGSGIKWKNSTKDNQTCYRHY